MEDIFDRFEKVRLIAYSTGREPILVRLSPSDNKSIDWVFSGDDVYRYSDGPEETPYDGNFFGLPIDMTSGRSHMLCDDGTQIDLSE